MWADLHRSPRRRQSSSLWIYQCLWSCGNQTRTGWSLQRGRWDSRSRRRLQTSLSYIDRPRKRRNYFTTCHDRDIDHNLTPASTPSPPSHIPNYIQTPWLFVLSYQPSRCRVDMEILLPVAADIVMGKVSKWKIKVKCQSNWACLIIYSFNCIWRRKCDIN